MNTFYFFKFCFKLTHECKFDSIIVNDRLEIPKLGTLTEKVNSDQ